MKFFSSRKQTIWSTLFLFLLSGCTSSVEISVPKGKTKLFVNAYIEKIDSTFGTSDTIDNNKVIVILSNSLANVTQISLSNYVSSTITNANVSIEVEGKTYKLFLDSFDYTANLELPFSAPTQRKIYFYFYTASNNVPYLLDVPYNLNITYDGVLYSGTTIIPNTRKKIDSIYFKKSFFFDRRRWLSMFVSVTDPIQEENYIRGFVATNSSINNTFYNFFPTSYRGGSITVEDDVLDNGKSIADIRIPKSRNKIIGACLSENNYIENNQFGSDNYDETNFRDQCRTNYVIGDTLYYKISSITKQSFDYISTQEFSSLTVANPFAQPIRVRSTLNSSVPNNEVLGSFVGYRSFIYKVIADTSQTYIY